MFAKIFESEIHGQLLVKIDSGDDGPEVRTFFQPKNLGVCSLAVGFKDTDSGWDSAEELFSRVSCSDAEGTVAIAKKQLGI